MLVRLNQRGATLPLTIIVIGAVVSGLNVKLGQIVPQTAIGNGNKTFQYHSCNLTRALGHIGSIQRIQNGWTDTWSSY